MISIRQALALNTDNIIYDFCGRTLKIKSSSVTYYKGEPCSVRYYCSDINTGALLYFTHYEIYQDYDDLCDEDKAFLSWIRSKDDCHTMCDDELLLLKDAFLSGFNHGISYTFKRKADEQLQK